jgi:hypothetical protein
MATIATQMQIAMSAYSIAVAPHSLLANLFNSGIIFVSCDLSAHELSASFRWRWEVIVGGVVL